MIKNITEQKVLQMCVDSVRRTGGLDYFYGEIIRRHLSSVVLSEVKTFIAEHSSEIFRRGRDVDLKERISGSNYESVSFGSRSVEADVLAGFREKVISKQPLVIEIPNYVEVIKGRGAIPSHVYLIEYKYFVYDLVTIQPLFKVVASFSGGANQLFIVGRDRYTRDPFALGIPNGFISQSIQVCLRWTMNLHVGDDVSEV